MSMLQARPVLHKYIKPQCILCGDEGQLTREHKIKQSVLAGRFGKEKLCIGSMDDFATGSARHIQSPKSKYLKFVSPICEACNTRRTQPGDMQFDALITSLDEAHRHGIEPARVFASKRFAVGTEERLSLLRHFAKIMCNFLADSDCPIPTRLSTFAIGRGDTVPLQIGLERNPDYENISAVLGEFSYAVHQGLSISGKEDLEPNYIRCATSFGPVSIYYWLYFTSREKSEFKKVYPREFARITDMIREAKKRTTAEGPA